MTDDDPDRRRQVSEAVHRQAVEIEPDTSAAVRAAAEAAGAELVDLESRIKSVDSIADKLRRMAARGIRKYRAPEGAAEKLEDTLRYTSVFDPELFTVGVGGLIRGMQAQGYALTRLPPWRSSGPYRGINMTFEAPNGTLVEIQAHTRDSLELRHRNHDLYEDARDPDRPKGMREEAVDEMTGRAAGLEMPPGADQLRKEDFT